MKALKIILAALGSVLVLLVIVAIVFIRTFDANDYKDEITAFVQERTGRTLTIDENIELSLFPWLAVETGGVSLSDDPAFGERSFFTIDELSARVRVWPLLRRQIEIGRIVLDGVNLNLGMDAEGRGNWASLLPTTAPEATESADAEPEPERPAFRELAAEGIELRSSRILWHDPNGEVLYLIRELGLETGPIDDGAPVELSLALSLLDVASQASAAIELESTVSIAPVPGLGATEATIRVHDSRQRERGRATLNLDSIRLDLDSEHVSVSGLEVRSGGLAATISAEGDMVLSEPRLAGTVGFRGASIAELLTTLGLEAPAGSGDASLGGFTGTAGFDLALAPLALEVERFALSALGAEASGQASLAADRTARARIDIPAFRPSAALIALIEPHVPEGTNLGALSSASANAALALTADDRLDVETFAVTLDTVRLGGRVALTGLDAPERIDGSLTVSGLDNRLLTALLGPMLPAELLEAELGELRLRADFGYTPASATAVLDPLELSAFGLTGQGRLTLVNADPLALSGQARLAEFSPKALLARFGLPVPESADPTVLGSAELAASFETTGDSGRFRDIVVELDDSRITGELSVEDFANPSYRFVLNADRIDVDRYLPPRGGDAREDAAGDAAAAGPGERKLGDIRLASEPLTATVVSGTASVGSLDIGGMHFEQLGTGLAIGAGRAELRSVRTQLYGGEFQGGLAVDATGDATSVRLTGNATTLAMRPLLEAMLGDAHLSGTGNFELDLTGRGDTIGEAMQTAAGRLSISLSNGQLEGVNIGHSLCAAANAARQLPAPAAAPEVTAYTEIRGSATVSDGVASTSNLYAGTAFLDMTGLGTIRLADQWIDTSFTAELKGGVPLAGCERLNAIVADDPIPVSFGLEGKLPGVELTPDVGALVQDWIRRELRNRGEDAIRDRVEDAIRGLFD